MREDIVDVKHAGSTSNADRYSRTMEKKLLVAADGESFERIVIGIATSVDCEEAVFL